MAVWSVPVLFLILYLLSTGSGVTDVYVENVSPTPNTTVAELEGPTNITFNCDTYEISQQGVMTRVTTQWTYRLPAMPEDLVIIDPNVHTEFIIDGLLRDGPGPFPNFRNRLTIVRMTSRLEGAWLFCGHAIRPLESWTLRLYRVPVLRGGMLVRVAEGDSILVDIESSPAAYPTPTSYQWVHEGVGVTSTPRLSYSYASVQFGPVDRSDSGLYTLSATNHRLGGSGEVGTGSGNFTLDVLYGPDIVTERVRYTAQEGDMVTLVCGRGLESKPAAEVFWIDPSGAPVSEGGRVSQSVDQGVVSLQLSGVRANDSGEWRCVLSVSDPGVMVSSGRSLVPRNSTQIGSRSIPVYLTVVVPPSMPRLVEINPEDIEPTAITLSWREPQSPGQPGVAFYEVTANDGLAPPIIRAYADNETTQTLTNLLPGTRYALTVRAIAQSGGVMARSLASLPVTITTGTTVPALACESASSEGGMVGLQWSLRHTGGLPLTVFNISYGYDGGRGQVPGANASNEALTVASLVSGFLYNFTLRAENAMGGVTSICPFVNHVIGVPRELSVLSVERVGGDSVEVVLNTPSSGVASGQLLYYDVEYFTIPNGSPTSVVYTVPGGGVATERISGLMLDSQYQFRARARNQYGASSFVTSEPVTLNGTLVSTETFAVIGAAVGGALGGLLLLLLIVVIVVVLAVRCQREGGAYQVHNRKARSLHLSPNETMHTYAVSPTGVKVEEVTMDVGEELEAPKELHYADLDTFQSPSVATKPATPTTSPVARVQYATIDSFKTAFSPTPSTDAAQTSNV